MRKKKKTPEPEVRFFVSGNGRGLPPLHLGVHFDFFFGSDRE